MKLKTMINLAQGHNAVTLVRLKLATPRSRVKHHCAPCVRACVYVCVCVCVCVIKNLADLRLIQGISEGVDWGSNLNISCNISSVPAHPVTPALR